MPKYAPFQERVIAERTELDSNRAKLKEFLHTDLFVALPQDEKDRLNKQLSIMTELSDVLTDRIDHFKPVEGE